MADAPKEASNKTSEEGKEAGSSKKVSSMNAKELAAAIEKTQKNMGGLWSRHGKMLADHLTALSTAAPSSPSAPAKKASKKTG